MSDNVIELKTVTELLGMNFYISDYQRGYRWTKTNVLQLLDDIWEYRNNDNNQKTFYCLQPVVVKERQWDDASGNKVKGYELIDGQQRLTTIHRILSCILLQRYGKADLKARGYKDNLFSIYYQTRLTSKEFLESDAYDSSAPDLYYMSEAFKSIKNWFADTDRGIPDDVMDEVRKILLPFVKEGQKAEWSVQVIWYEIKDANQKSENLFTRLNRGKIPLTSAELIKACFVNNQSMKDLPETDQLRRKTELIQLWDEIEVQLNDPSFWSFITNLKATEYSNKIELLFDTMTGKEPKETDPLFSFVRFFSAKETSETLWKKWIEVEEIYRSLDYWYKNKLYHHKIGYLIATGTSIKVLVKLRKEMPKNEFIKALNLHIAKQIPENWEDLRFDKSSDKETITNVLLLHNLEKMNANKYEVFPFAAYKGIKKSLEHIHAQNIEDMDPRIQEPWITWLHEHLTILKDLNKDEAVTALEEEIIKAIPKLEFNQFKILANKILQLLPADSENSNEYLHKIENMALLGLKENIILGNSVFEVKRRKIVAMDKEGAFLPVVTKRIFLKYFANENNNNHSIWTKEERAAYKKDITDTLHPYITLKQKSLN